MSPRTLSVSLGCTLLLSGCTCSYAASYSASGGASAGGEQVAVSQTPAQPQHHPQSADPASVTGEGAAPRGNGTQAGVGSPNSPSGHLAGGAMQGVSDPGGPVAQAGGTQAAPAPSAEANSVPGASDVPGHEPAASKPNAISNAPVSPESAESKERAPAKKSDTRHKVAHAAREKPRAKPRPVQTRGGEELLVQAVGRPIMPVKPAYRAPMKSALPEKGAPSKPDKKSAGTAKPAAIVKSAPPEKPATPVKSAEPEKGRGPVKTAEPSKGGPPPHAEPTVKSGVPPKPWPQKPATYEKPGAPPSKEHVPSK